MASIDRFFIRLGAVISGVFLLALLIALKEVAWRYLLAAPSSWGQDASTTLCAIGFAFGGVYALARREHIRVTVLCDLLPAAVNRAVVKIGLACGIFYLAGLSYGLGLLAHDAVFRFYDGRWTPESTIIPPYLPLPSLTKTALFLGAALFLLLSILQVFDRRR